MAEYIERETAKAKIREKFKFVPARIEINEVLNSIPAADVRPVVLCRDCKHNNACLTQAFVEEASRVPFNRNTFFCADGKRAEDA